MVNLKKYSALFLFVILLAAIVYGYIWFRSKNIYDSDTRVAIPLKTAVFIEFNDISSLIHEINSANNIWTDLQKIKHLNSFTTVIQSLDSVVNKNEEIKKIFSKKFTIAVSLSSNKNPEILYIIPEAVKDQKEIILDFFEQNTGNFNYTKRRFESLNVYDLSWTDKKGTRNFTFTVIKGLILGSFAGELVEESVLQIRSGTSLTGQVEFKEVAGTIGEKVRANLFINYKNLPEMINHLSSGKELIKSSRFTNFADWGAFDAGVYSDRIILNGFTSLNDTTSRDLSIFNDQEPIEFTSLSFLPSFINFFKLYGFSDNRLLFTQIARKFESDNSLKKLISQKTHILNTYQIDLDKNVRELISNEYGMALSTERNISHEYFFIKLKSQSIAEEIFTGWIKTYAERNGLKWKDLSMNARIDNNISIPVYNLPLGGIPSMVFGDEFESVRKDYFAFINNYIVFSNSFESLKYFIYQVILGKTISTDPAYSSLKEHISSFSNLYIFIRPYSFIDRSVPDLNQKIRETIGTSGDRLKKLNAISVQFSASDNLFYNHILINHSGQISDNVKTVWESRLDTIINFKPAIVINHNTGEKEIFIQDCSNQIYLLSNAGLILWKQKIDGRILSDIHQVDYFGNKKLQYLFNTGSKIYLIDRNGNPVEKFPVSLRSGAAAGMSVFDYDRDGVIRICIPCEDRNIYMYDKEGKIIPGWKPDKTDNEVNRPVQHFRAGSRDYIVAIDEFKFYIMDRKGNNRIKPSKLFPVSIRNSFYLDNTKGTAAASFITTDTAGNIMKVNMNGKVEKIHEQNLHPEHYFVMTDLDGDKYNEYIITSGNEFFVLNYKGNKEFSHKLESEIKIKPVIYNFAATDNRVGIVLNTEGIIYLYNNDGSVYKGFPLEGICPFSISSFPELKGKFNLIVGGKNNFLYNYFVQ